VSLLSLERVVQHHRQRASGEPVEALRVGQLEVQRGEVLAVLGANGSGKSTLLETMAFLRPPDQGRVLLGGDDPWPSDGALAARRRCPMLLQKTLLFSTTVLGNVTFGLRLRGLDADSARSRALRALDRVGLAGFEQRRHHELSGGEARRVALARVLALDCDLLVLDEPTAGLDAEGSLRVEQLVRELSRERGATVVLSSHSQRRAVALASRVVTLVEGHLVPVNLDNRALGRLRRVAEGWEFRAHAGWVHVFDERSFAVDAWAGIGPCEGPVHMGLSAQGVRLRPPGAPGPASLEGEVDTIRREADASRVRLRLPQGQRVRARVPLGELERSGVRLGGRAALVFAPGSVYLVPTRRSASS